MELFGPLVAVLFIAPGFVWLTGFALTGVLQTKKEAVVQGLKSLRFEAWTNAIVPHLGRLRGACSNFQDDLRLLSRYVGGTRLTFQSAERCLEHLEQGLFAIESDPALVAIRSSDRKTG